MTQDEKLARALAEMDYLAEERQREYDARVKRVYLAGPILGTTDMQASGWRDVVRDALPGIKFVSPMARDYRGKEDENAQAIVDGDLADIASCDLVFAFCWQPSAGTPMEIRYAFAELHLPTIIVAAAPVSPWLRAHATALCATLGDGIVELARRLSLGAGQ